MTDLQASIEIILKAIISYYSCYQQHQLLWSYPDWFSIPQSMIDMMNSFQDKHFIFLRTILAFFSSCYPVKLWKSSLTTLNPLIL